MKLGLPGKNLNETEEKKMPDFKKMYDLQQKRMSRNIRLMQSLEKQIGGPDKRRAERGKRLFRAVMIDTHKRIRAGETLGHPLANAMFLTHICDYGYEFRPFLIEGY